MGRRTSSFLSFIIVTMMYTVPLLAGNGTLSGRMYDALTHRPISGIVHVTGTSRGGTSDSTGRFFILGIPAGTYDVRCSAVGYQSRLLTGLLIAPDALLMKEFALQPAGVDLEEVVVVADRTEVESSGTSARTTFDGAEFTMLPIHAAMDLVGLSPGTFKQFFGGVLPVFSRTEIDGIDVTDETALWYAEQIGIDPSRIAGGRDLATAERTSFTEPNITAIEQATLRTGTSGSDYAGAAGTLSYSLREGRGPWKGEVSLRVSQLGGLRHLGPNVYWDAEEYRAQRAYLSASKYANDRLLAGYYTWTAGKYSYGRRPDVTASFAAGGSLSDEMGLFVTGAWHSSPDKLPNEKRQLFNGSVKLTWGISPTVRVSVVGLLEDRGRLFGSKNRSYSDTYRYFLEGVPLWDGMHFTGSAKCSFVPSPSTTVDLQLNLVYDGIRRGFCDDNSDGIVSLEEHGEFLTWADPSQVRQYQAAPGDSDYRKFFGSGLVEDGSSTKLISSSLSWKVARPPIYYENFVSRVVTLKADVATHANHHHLVGFGAQVRLHVLDRELRNGAYAVGIPGYRSFIEEVWTRHPVDLSVYLQDRIEISDLVVNAGLRLEGSRLDAAPIANWFAAPDTITNARGDPTLTPRRGTPLPWKWFISPRVAFSHPIGRDAAVHASFSRTRIPLPYSYMYSNYNTSWNLGLLDPIPVVDMECDPISAWKYGLGIQWMVARSTLIGVNAYYQTYGNMEQRYVWPAIIRVVPRIPLPQYYAVTNAFEVETRGMELSIRRDRTPLIFGISGEGRIAYSYSHINAASPVPSNKLTYSAYTGDSTAYDGRIPFGDIASWDRSNIESAGGGSSVTAGYNRTHRITCAFSFLVPGDIRLSGVGMFSSGFWFPEKLKADRIVPYAESPWNRRIDLRLEKQWQISTGVRVAVFVDILNAFDWTNVLTYVNATETAQTAWEVNSDPTGGPGINRPVADQASFVYDIPRETYFGVRIGF